MTEMGKDVIDMSKDVIGLGGQCWLAKLLKPLRDSPTHLFDWVATTPSMVAHIFGDDGVKLLDTTYYRSKGDKAGRIQHEGYEAFVMDETVGHVPQQMMPQTLPAMFQHNTEGGPTELCAKLEKRWKLMRTRLAGTQWKVLVYGFAIPWSMYEKLLDLFGATVRECLLDAELQVLFEKLEQHGIDNFALVGLVVVHGVPAHAKFQEQRRVLSPEYTPSFQVAIRYNIPFESTLRGANFQGSMARRERLTVCNQLKAISDQLGWCEAFDHAHGSYYWYNPHLSICVWEKRVPHGQVTIQVGMIVETKAATKTNSVENGYEGVLQKGTRVEILYVGKNDAEAGYLFGEVCGTKHHLWLHFTCIGEAGCQCFYDLEDVAAQAFPLIKRVGLHAYPTPEVWTSGTQRSLTTAPSAFGNWKHLPQTMALADSTLLLHGEKHVFVQDMDGQPLGDIVGQYGGCFCTGTFSDIQRIIETVFDNFSRFGRSGERLRVAYVPAENSHPNHEFPRHQEAQSFSFALCEWIATPKLNDLREQCEMDTGCALFKARGVHCTEPGRKWLQKYLFRWANEKGVSLLFCVGWNSNNATTEYRMQLETRHVFAEFTLPTFWGISFCHNMTLENFE